MPYMRMQAQGTPCSATQAVRDGLRKGTVATLFSFPQMSSCGSLAHANWRSVDVRVLGARVPHVPAANAGSRHCNPTAPETAVVNAR